MWGAAVGEWTQIACMVDVGGQCFSLFSKLKIKIEGYQNHLVVWAQHHETGSRECAWVNNEASIWLILPSHSHLQGGKSPGNMAWRIENILKELLTC